MLKNKIGIYLDIENFIGSITAERLPLKLEVITTYAKSLGDITFMKSYGDLSITCKKCEKYTLDSLRELLSKNMVHIEDIPYNSRHKNSADISLALDCYNHAMLNKINVAIIVSSDKDFIPLFSKLAELGIEVVCITTSITSAKNTILHNNMLYKDLLSIKNSQSSNTSVAPKKSQREQLAEMLNIPVPTRSSIRTILQSSVELLKASDKNVMLASLATSVANATLHNQSLIYRILLSLTFTNGLELRSPVRNRNNPIVKSFNESMTIDDLTEEAISQLAALYNKIHETKLDISIFND